MASSAKSQKQESALNIEEVIAVVTGLADTDTKHRVWSESLTSPALRNQLAKSFLQDEKEGDTEERVDSAPSEQLKMRLQTLAESFIKPTFPEVTAQIMDRVLTVIETVLTLPCFAPALAAPDPIISLNITSETIHTAEAVQITFQQLPSVEFSEETVPTLRVLVDASALDTIRDYNKVVVTIASAETKLPLIVPLNTQGQGYLDVSGIPPAKSLYRLVAVQLSP